MATLRKIQPAHKSERVTVAQAMEAWRKTEGKPLVRARKVTVPSAKRTAAGRAKAARTSLPKPADQHSG